MAEEKQTMKSFALSLGSRKLILSVAAIVAVVGFVDVDPAAKMDFLKWVVGLYLGANVLTRVADRFKS